MRLKRLDLKVGAFFIVGYPAKATKQCWIPSALLQACRLITSPSRCPIRFREPPSMNALKDDGVSIEDWEEPKNYRLIRHKLLYASGFSEGKLKFAIGKAQAQYYGRRYLGKSGYRVLGEPFERLTDHAFQRMR